MLPFLHMGKVELGGNNIMSDKRAKEEEQKNIELAHRAADKFLEDYYPDHNIKERGIVDVVKNKEAEEVVRKEIKDAFNKKEDKSNIKKKLNWQYAGVESVVLCKECNTPIYGGGSRCRNCGNIIG